MTYLVLDKAKEGVVQGLELLRLPDQGKALTVSTAQRPPHVHCRHTKLKPIRAASIHKAIILTGVAFQRWKATT